MLQRVLVTICIALLGASCPRAALGQEEPAPSAADVEAAGIAFDAGRQAFREDRYAEAAEYFEQANGLAPNAKVLANAASARLAAAQPDRAATLAALVLRLYPNDEKLSREASAVLERSTPGLHKLFISCSELCQLLIGSRLVPGRPSVTHLVYLEPGEYEIKASFSASRTLKLRYAGEADKHGALTFTAPPLPERSEPAADSGAKKPEPPALEADTLATKPQSGISPAFFWIGSGLTVVGAGLSTLSYLDAKKNPGAERVREECVAQGESCALYQEGKRKDQRTLIAWVATGVFAASTGVVGAFFTNWRSAAVPSSGPHRGTNRVGSRQTQLAFSPEFDGRRLGLSATGRF